jgi:hypothetical protein
MPPKLFRITRASAIDDSDHHHIQHDRSRPLLGNDKHGRTGAQYQTNDTTGSQQNLWQKSAFFVRHLALWWAE